MKSFFRCLSASELFITRKALMRMLLMTARPSIKMYLLSMGLLSLQFSCGGNDDNSQSLPPPASFVTRNITVTTDDNIDIAVVIKKPVDITTPQPAVIFIHANNTDGKSEWVNSSLYDELFENDYVVLAYDIRTFGVSGNDGGSRFDLLTNPDRAPLDLKAVINFLKADPDIDNSRIAAIGSKLGAELACVGNGSAELIIKTAVSLSTVDISVVTLSANSSNFQLKSVFYIAGELEASGSTALDAQTLFDKTQEPRKVTIISGSQATGSELIDGNSTLSDEIVAWISNNL